MAARDVDPRALRIAWRRRPRRPTRPTKAAISSEIVPVGIDLDEVDEPAVGARHRQRLQLRLVSQSLLNGAIEASARTGLEGLAGHEPVGVRKADVRELDGEDEEAKTSHSLARQLLLVDLVVVVVGVAHGSLLGVR
jgi:hypothetical protein